MSLRRRLVYIHPMAVDKAILVRLNYRNAYGYWSEQRRTLNKEVLTATQQVRDKTERGEGCLMAVPVVVSQLPGLLNGCFQLFHLWVCS